MGQGQSGRARCWPRAGLLPLLLAAPVLPAFAAWCVGWFVDWFVGWFVDWFVGWFVVRLAVREYPGEVGARRRLEVQKGQIRTS